MGLTGPFCWKYDTLVAEHHALRCRPKLLFKHYIVMYTGCCPKMLFFTLFGCDIGCSMAQRDVWVCVFPILIESLQLGFIRNELWHKANGVCGWQIMCDGVRMLVLVRACMCVFLCVCVHSYILHASCIARLKNLSHCCCVTEQFLPVYLHSFTV